MTRRKKVSSSKIVTPREDRALIPTSRWDPAEHFFHLHIISSSRWLITAIKQVCRGSEVLAEAREGEGCAPLAVPPQFSFQFEVFNPAIISPSSFCFPPSFLKKRISLVIINAKSAVKSHRVALFGAGPPTANWRVTLRAHKILWDNTSK